MVLSYNFKYPKFKYENYLENLKQITKKREIYDFLSLMKSAIKKICCITIQIYIYRDCRSLFNTFFTCFTESDSFCCNKTEKMQEISKFSFVFKLLIYN